MELRSLECDSTGVSDGMSVELEKDVQLAHLPRTSTLPNRELSCSCWAQFCRGKGAQIGAGTFGVKLNQGL